MILTLTYGKTTPTSYDDLEVVRINKGSLRLVSVIKNVPWPVDKYPFLRYLPFPHIRMLKRYHDDEVKLFTEQVETTRQGTVSQ